MKKMVWLFLFGLLMLFPVAAHAEEGIKNYYIDLTVEENGDVFVKEMFVLEGTFNGFERIINYVNPYAPKFDGSLSSYNGSDIYNASALTLLDVQATSKTELWKQGIADGVSFQKVNYASKGDYGVYTIEKTSYGNNILIFNPSSYNTRGFYVEYRLKNMAVVHEDVAEVGFNLFSDQLRERIKRLELTIHVPKNQQALRAWAHGPLWGETKNIDLETIFLTIEDLDPNTPVDIRFVFSKNVVAASSKLSKQTALPSILKVEAEKAEEANLVRENIRKEQAQKQLLGRVVLVLQVGWILGLIYFLFRAYFKYDREYKSSFQNDYYRDFPADYGPEIVGYLFHRSIGNDDLSAAILNLIQQKIVDFKEIGEKKKDYQLQLIVARDSLSSKQQFLVSFLFDDKEEVLLSTLKKSAKKNYEDFLARYENWKKSALKEAKQQNFYEEQNGPKALLILYSVLGFFLGIGALMVEVGTWVSLLVIFVAIGSLVYFASMTKRTKRGNDDYLKWNALKKFMLDFGTMQEKELPEIKLWEKYLVYAVSLGCAEKLAKSMKIRMEEMQVNTTDLGYDPMWMYHRMYMMMSFNRVIHSTVQSSMSAAQSARVAASSNSSSGGFGGGFSGGGGSFGGGGGGGRF